MMKAAKKLVFVALIALAIVFAAVAPSQARGNVGNGPVGHPRAFEGHRGFPDHHDFDRRGHGGVFIGIAPPIYWGPTYLYDWGYPVPAYPPAYWYYCPSAGAYYPNVPSCPEPWIAVPAS